MKKIIVVFIISLLMTSFSFAAVQIGDEIGDVLYTDIVTKINGVNINSFNINGSTAVYITELKKLGYDVKWDGDTRTVKVFDNSEQEIISSETEGVEEYLPEDQGLTVGTGIGKVLHTDIETYLEGTKVESFNINGSTAIYVDALSTLGIEYEWDGDNRQVLIRREPRKKLRINENYKKVKFTKVNDEYVLDHSTLPEAIENNYEAYNVHSSNLYTEEFSDEELFQRNYNPLKDSIHTREGQVKLNPGYSYAYTIISLYNDEMDLLGIMQFPKTENIDEKSFELNLYDPKDYDYEKIIADQKNYISENIEKSQILEDEWIDIIYKSSINDFAFFVNESQLSDTLKSDAYFVNGSNYDKEYNQHLDIDELLTNTLSKEYFETYDHSSWNYAHSVAGTSTTIDKDSIVFLTLFDNEKELLGYKKTNFNEMMSDEPISTYKQVKVVPIEEGSVLYGFKYDGNHVNALDENVFGPFKAPVNLDKIELDGEYQELLIEDYKN